MWPDKVLFQQSDRVSKSQEFPKVIENYTKYSCINLTIYWIIQEGFINKFIELNTYNWHSK